MNNRDLSYILHKVNFIDFYKGVCQEYNDFDNRLRGVHNSQYESALQSLGFKYEYFKKEEFYRIKEKIDEFEFELQITLKDGIVEPMLNVKKGNEYYFPYGRFDFIPQKMGIDFDREKFNLPKYNSFEEMNEILTLIKILYEKIVSELIENECNSC